MATLPHSAPLLADAFETGTRVLPRTIQANKDLEGVFTTLADFSQDPGVRGGIDQLDNLAASLRPTLRFLTPAQTTCNYATLWFRNAASLLADGDSHGTWQRFQVVSATDSANSPKPLSEVVRPNNEGEPSSAPANGPTKQNHLHFNPYPNTAAPGQTQGVRGRQRGVHQTAGKTTIGNAPGTSRTKTDGQKR